MNTEHTTSAPIKKKKLLVSFLDSDHKERFFNLVEANTDGAGDLTLMYGFSSNPALYNAFVQFSAVMKTNSKLNEFPLTIDDNLLTVENLMLITALEEISFNSGKASIADLTDPSKFSNKVFFLVINVLVLARCGTYYV